MPDERETEFNVMIWKQVLVATDVQVIKLPRGAEILCACEQHGEMCAWFRFDPLEKDVLIERKIAIVGTGNQGPPDHGRYLGTAFLHGGSLVFHIFEQSFGQ